MKSAQKIHPDCPHCGTRLQGITGTGCWICPECGGDIDVVCECPECYQEVEIRKWGRYTCPDEACTKEFDAARNAHVSARFRLIDCPGCGVRVEGITGTGDWMCSTCKILISVRSFCPRCGQEVEVNEWGSYFCPAESCGCDFKPGTNVFVSTEEHGPVRRKSKGISRAGKPIVKPATCGSCDMKLFVLENSSDPRSVLDGLVPLPPLRAGQIRMPVMQCPVCGRRCCCWPSSNVK